MFFEMSIPLGIGIGIIKLVSLGFAINDTDGSVSIYDGVFGMFLMALKILQWLFFEYSLYETSGSEFLNSGVSVKIRGAGSREEKVRRFLKLLGVFGTFFILGFVMFYLFGALLIPSNWIHTFVEISRFLFEGGVLVAMGSLVTKKTGMYRDVSLIFKSELYDVFE